MLTATYTRPSGLGLIVANQTLACAGATYSPECVDLMSTLLDVAPHRDVVAGLSAIMLAGNWYFGRSSLGIPDAIIAAMQHHASADPILATSTLSRLITDQEYGVPVDFIIDVLVENLSTGIPADIRARSILKLTAMADDSSSPWQAHARTALAKIAHLSAAPTPPVRQPPPPIPSPKTTVARPPTTTATEDAPLPLKWIAVGLSAVALFGLVAMIATSERRFLAPAT